jgi:hypothetical protein
MGLCLEDRPPPPKKKQTKPFQFTFIRDFISQHKQSKNEPIFLKQRLFPKLLCNSVYMGEGEGQTTHDSRH